MSTELSMRPRIRLISHAAPDALAADIAAFFRENNTEYEGYVVKHHIVLDIEHDKVHFWSPRLEVDLEPHEKGTLVRGLMGPRPGVWGFLMFMYGACGFAAFFSLIIGLSDWTLGIFPWELFVTAGSIIGIFAVYLFAQGGKRIVHDEMVALRDYFKEAIGDSYEVLEEPE